MLERTSSLHFYKYIYIHTYTLIIYPVSQLSFAPSYLTQIHTELGFCHQWGLCINNIPACYKSNLAPGRSGESAMHQMKQRSQYTHTLLKRRVGEQLLLRNRGNDRGDHNFLQSTARGDPWMMFPNSHRHTMDIRNYGILRKFGRNYLKYRGNMKNTQK